MNTEEKKKAINSLRGEMGNTKYVLRDETHAKEQLQKTLEWRKMNNVDNYPVSTRENDLPVLYAVRGFPSVGDSNLVAHPGVSESVLRINEHMGVEEIQGYHIGCNEFLHRVIMKDCSEMAGRHINRETVIFDCTGMGWHQLHMPALSFLRAIAECDQSYYPETMNKLFLVNAPSAFVYVWKIVKAWLDPGTIDKIQILGTDYQESLLKHIPAENLPSFLGGQCTCSHIDGGCVPSQVTATTSNEKVNTSYNTKIMNEAKISDTIRGPPFMETVNH
ncbi:CRAL-TRIO domain-containing protein [Pilobolus umbonatus]|nr:CRAL-TRIO domain-containing protein [Pilobolus umbonatus]